MVVGQGGHRGDREDCHGERGGAESPRGAAGDHAPWASFDRQYASRVAR